MNPTSCAVGLKLEISVTIHFGKIRERFSVQATRFIQKFKNTIKLTGKLATLTLLGGAALMALAPESHAWSYGDVVGVIDGVSSWGGNYYVTGWACALGNPQSIAVHMYVGGDAGSGHFAEAVGAYQASEPAVAAACLSTGSAYRFSFPLPSYMISLYAGMPIYVHAISPTGGPNNLINNSGNTYMPFPKTTGLQLISVNSGKCADVAGISQANGAQVWQYDCFGQAAKNQIWDLQPVGNNEYEIISENSGRCMDVSGISQYNGAAVDQWDCWNGPNQRWRIEGAGNNVYRIVSVNSGKCLDVAGYSTSNMAILQQWDCHGGTNQMWSLTTFTNVAPNPIVGTFPNVAPNP
jgi:hypothetical protein